MRPPGLPPKSWGILLLLVALLAASVLLYLKLGSSTGRSPSTHRAVSAESTLTSAIPAATQAPATPEPVPVGNDAGLVELVSAIVGPQTEPSIRAWSDDLLHGDEEKRTNAIGELGFLDDPRWVPVVIRVLREDPQAEVRSAAAAALATQSTSPEAAHALTAALADPEEAVREDVLLSLKAIRNSVVEKDLRRLLADNQLDANTTRELRLFLDRYYVHKDPLADPLDK